MADVELSNVSKTYDGAVEALRGVDLRVADGELMVVVGPSGSGKSTLLRLVAGLEELSAGEIRIGGRAAGRLPPRQRDVAMVPQEYTLYPHMTVERNITFALRLRGVGRDQVRARVAKVAGLLGIEDLLPRRPHALSGGQQQRVALARAIVREPAAFLFDEPLSNLDAPMRVATRAELKDLLKRLGTTALYVTHDQEEAMSLGDRLAVIGAGQLQQVGTPREIYANPANRFVGSFIGSPPMNLLEGRLEAVAGGLAFVERAPEARPLALPDRWRAALERHAGGPVVLGVRPQGLRLAGETAGAALQVRVEHVDHLGETVDLVGVSAGGQRVVARVPAGGDTPGPGRVRFAVDMDRAFAFEAGAFGRNLLCPPAAG